MTILENLWYGNIRPVEEFVEGNAEYKNLLRIVGKNREKFETTLSPEQAELFGKYIVSVNELCVLKFCLQIRIYPRISIIN